MTYYDRLNAFFQRINEEPLNPSAQLVYLHLLHMNNDRKNSGRFYCTDSKLIELTRFTKDTITQAKRRLKNLGYINFKTDKKNPRAGTLYIIPDGETKTAAAVERKTDKSIDNANQEILQAWLDCTSEAPNKDTCRELATLAQEHGAEVVVNAIHRASKNPFGVNMYTVKFQINNAKGKGDSGGVCSDNRINQLCI